MTNKELIIQLLDSDLSAECELTKVIEGIVFKPEKISTWVREGQKAVHCELCSCRTSIVASKDMDYCFKCGARMVQLDAER